MYWAQELAAQTADADLAAEFAPIAQSLTSNEDKIVSELVAGHGKEIDMGGYYLPNDEFSCSCNETIINFKFNYWII